ncbi:MAG TPA: hypothetical protein VIU40_15775 [Geobacteraceae bacterium]
MKLPRYIKHPEQIRKALDEHIARTTAPGYIVGVEDLAELANLNRQYADYLKWIGEHQEALDG